MGKGKKKRAVSGLMTVLIMAAVLVGVLTLYYSISNTMKDKKSKDDEIQIVETILDKDLSTDYPATPRETVKLYSRIISCFYNFELSEEQIAGLADQARLLFDDELDANNPYDTYLESLKTEIAQYQEKGRTITEYEIEQGSSVKYYDLDGKKYATVLVEYTMLDDEGHYRSNQSYTLRKDDNGNWRILGWELVDDIDFDNH